MNQPVIADAVTPASSASSASTRALHLPSLIRFTNVPLTPCVLEY
ncbi:hypothetical protein [Bacillus sp. ISL-4]|nr:hypothetical protein [Bacillus sp. ISL-4]